MELALRLSGLAAVTALTLAGCPTAAPYRPVFTKFQVVWQATGAIEPQFTRVSR